MFKKFHILLLACLFGAFWIASDSFTTIQSRAAAQVRLTFDFTPVPTATKFIDVADNTTSFTDQFTVELATATPLPEIVVSAEIPTLPQTAQLNKNEKPQPQPTETIVLIERPAFAHHFIQTRNALSSLTYLINVADADGVLTCSQIMQYYDQTANFEHFTPPPALQTAHDYYIRSLNIATIGVNPLYSFCQQQLADELSEDEIAVQDVKPESVWTRAVDQSNAALHLNNTALEWLNGSTRLLSSIYNQFDRHLHTYYQMLSQPLTIEDCPTIRQSFELSASNATQLDLGDQSEFFSSYDKYARAINFVSETGRRLYDYCNPTVEQLEQLAEPQLHQLPHELVDSARNGILEAQVLMTQAHYYISPEALDD